MLRLPLLLALLLALLSAIPAAQAVAAAPTAAAVVASDGEDPGDEWSDEEAPGDDWGDEDPGAWDDEGDDAWAEEEPCLSDDEWSEDEEFASAAQSEDEDWEDWGDACDEEEWDEEGDDASAPAPVRLSKLHATPARRGAVRVRFRLDRGTHVTLTLQRLGGARASGKPHALRGTVRLDGRRGENATTLRRWKGHALQPGSYRLTATPDTNGARPASALFTLRAAATARR